MFTHLQCPLLLILIFAEPDASYGHVQFRDAAGVRLSMYIVDEVFVLAVAYL